MVESSDTDEDSEEEKAPRSKEVSRSKSRSREVSKEQRESRSESKEPEEQSVVSSDPAAATSLKKTHRFNVF